MELDNKILMDNIRTEARYRKSLASKLNASDMKSSPSISLSPIPIPHLPKPILNLANRYRLNDFLALHDSDFIDAAYRGILNRMPDDAGRQHFLGSLRNGVLSKIEILGRLRYSPEGRKNKVPVQGLLIAFAIHHAYRFPIIGNFIALPIMLVRLPKIVLNLYGMEAYQHQRNAELESSIRHLAQATETNTQRLSLITSHIANEVHTLTHRIELKQTQLQEQLDDFASKNKEIIQQMELQYKELKETTQKAESLHNEFTEQISVLEQRTDINYSATNKLKEYIVQFELQIISFENRVVNSELRSETLENRIAGTETCVEEFQRQLLEAGVMSQQVHAQMSSLIQDTLNVLEKRIEGLGSTLSLSQNNAQSMHERFTERMARAEGRLHEHSIRLLNPPAIQNHSKDVSASAKIPSRFERLYYAFEQRFRGSREDIRRRVAYYLPLLHKSVVGEEGAMVLDIGCGRGEWLELLRDEKIRARGIDINEKMVDVCTELGLDVSLGDAIVQLKHLPDNALGALTGFHIIEHISLETLLELFEQAYRVVQPGGLIIFETPNPENIIVGSCNFYTDPTHHRPLPPVLTQFLAEASGFVDVAIHRVNAALLPRIFDDPAESDPLALRTTLKFLNTTCRCAPDYSVVGYVP